MVYADDSSPTTSHEDANILLQNVENDWRKVTEWFGRNDMFCTWSKRHYRIDTQNVEPKVIV